MMNTLSAEELVEEILVSIQEKKGFDICVIDLRELKNAITSFFIICCGNTDRQTQAIADEVETQLKRNHKERPIHVEGSRLGEWVLMDYGNVMVHIFLPRIREFYNLEELWGDGEFRQIAN
jgi:ribosome-associated protein